MTSFKWQWRMAFLLLLATITPANAFTSTKPIPRRVRPLLPTQSVTDKVKPQPPARLQSGLNGWDGDDLRFWSRLRRKIGRGQLHSLTTETPAKTTLIIAVFSMFVYQTINTVNLIRTKNPAFWPSFALSIITDTLLGSTNIRGPLTTDFIFAASLAKRQPHRYLTAGFLHADIIHLFLNLVALRRLPTWIESGLGTPLFLTTFFVGVVSGNIGHAMASPPGLARSFCLGSSGGICGIYGLIFVALSKMGNTKSAGKVLKGVLLLFGAGLLLDSVSNAAHFGGFLGGIMIGLLCAPNYEKSYSMRRKWSLQVDNWSKEYRQMMGFGISPTKHGLIPVGLLWAIGALLLVVDPKLRSIPFCILRGLYKPGSLSWI